MSSVVAVALPVGTLTAEQRQGKACTALGAMCMDLQRDVVETFNDLMTAWEGVKTSRARSARFIRRLRGTADYMRRMAAVAEDQGDHGRAHQLRERHDRLFDTDVFRALVLNKS